MPSGASGPLAAVQFLTRVPVRLRGAPAAADLGGAVVWFPVVGAVVGAVAGAIAYFAEDLVGSAVAAALAVLIGVLITGAFHEDGLADFADAVAGGSTPERRHEILGDPRLGTYGVAALAGSIVLRIVCVAAVPPAAALGGLAAAHALGRGAAVGAMGWAPVARADGLGAAAAGGVDGRRALTGAGIAVGLAALTTGWWVGPFTAAAVASTLMVLAIARRTLGGITGDVLGAIEQVGECAVLVTVTALARRHGVWWS